MQQGRLAAISSLVFSCKRTQSRLIEMTGKDYLDKHALEHDGWGVCGTQGCGVCGTQSCGVQQRDNAH